MNLKNCSTVLFVKDIAVSKKFYSEILGLSIHLDFGRDVIYSCGCAIWEIQKDHIIPGKLGIGHISDNRINRFELCFETETLQQDYLHLKANSVEFLNEIHEEPWGQQTIRFFDPDRHLIEIGESMKQFVTRLHNSGLTIEELNKKTSVPIEEIHNLLKT